MFFYYIPLIQISVCLFSEVGFLALMISKRPFKTKAHFMIEFIKEFLFSIGIFFLFVLALDESYNIITVDTRVQIGWFVVVIFVIALLMSITLVIIPALKIISAVFKKKKNEG